ncbi:hypothetical protein NG799_06975 [Laspinema sp. D1]|uniref:Uncharacterized protein n=1 Tax=Laspinema palackyanum D2a TaxID=2953684 RepID=A0ABT2MMW4_9CYAN|nr:hypothetical protein [Laspinema sp. D2a]
MSSLSLPMVLILQLMRSCLERFFGNAIGKVRESLGKFGKVWESGNTRRGLKPPPNS